MGPLQSGYPDAPYSLPLIAPFVKNQKWNWSNMGSQGFNANCPYQTTYSIPPPQFGLFYPPTPAPCGVSGYVKPFAP
jgi:hypothetical protein